MRFTYSHREIHTMMNSPTKQVLERWVEAFPKSLDRTNMGLVLAEHNNIVKAPVYFLSPVFIYSSDTAALAEMDARSWARGNVGADIESLKSSEGQGTVRLSTNLNYYTCRM